MHNNGIYTHVMLVALPAACFDERSDGNLQDCRWEVGGALHGQGWGIHHPSSSLLPIGLGEWELDSACSQQGLEPCFAQVLIDQAAKAQKK